MVTQRVTPSPSDIAQTRLNGFLDKPTNKAKIIHAKLSNPKLNLRQISQLTGISYGYTRKTWSQYARKQVTLKGMPRSPSFATSFDVHGWFWWQQVPTEYYFSCPVEVSLNRNRQKVFRGSSRFSFVIFPSGHTYVYPFFFGWREELERWLLTWRSGDDARLLLDNLVENGQKHFAVHTPDVPENIRVRIKGVGTFQTDKTPYPDGTCYDAITEILTRGGFKFFKDLTYTDEIATLNGVGSIEYYKPQRIISLPYKGKMVKISGRSYDLLVTPDHKFFVREGWHKKNKSWQFIEANKFINLISPYEFKRDAKWEGKQLNFIELPIIKSNHKDRSNTKNIIKIPIVPWLKFMGAYLAEGSAFITGKKPQYIVQLAIPDPKDDSYREEVMAAINDMGFNTWLLKGEKQGYIRIASKQLCSYLKQYGKAWEKYVPQQIKDLDINSIKTFLTFLFRGDGNFENSEFRKYITTSKILADDVMELLLKIGVASTCSSPKLEKPVSMMDGRIITARHEVYRLSVSDVSLTPQIRKKHQLVDYNGLVYDVTVPNHVIFVRRNGKAVWSSNCEFIVDPEYVRELRRIKVENSVLVKRLEELASQNVELHKRLTQLADATSQLNTSFSSMLGQVTEGKEPSQQRVSYLV